MLKTIAILAALVLPAAAQSTYDSLTQALFNCRAQPGIRVMLIDSGKPKCAALDITIQFDPSCNCIKAAPQSGVFLIASEIPSRLSVTDPLTYRLSFAPLLSTTVPPVASLALFKNGVLLRPNVDYTLTGQDIRFVDDPTGAYLWAAYRR